MLSSKELTVTAPGSGIPACERDELYFRFVEVERIDAVPRILSLGPKKTTTTHPGNPTDLERT